MRKNCKKGKYDMFKVDIRLMDGEVRTVEFQNEIDREGFLKGETVYDVNDYWVSLDNAQIIKVWED